MAYIKKATLAVLLVIACLFDLKAQGISFFHGTFQEAINRAKAENKPLFVDVYTVWCGPCKKMVNEIFTLKEVGDKFNAEFVNYKLDAEKGEGIEFAKRYKVASYPTYLFINGEGALIYRSLGSMSAEMFIREAANATSEFKDPKPFAVWQDEYEANKNDKEFLWKYLQKRIKLKINSGDILDQYYSVSTKDEILASELIPNLFQFQGMNVDGPFYNLLLQNAETIKKLFKEKYNKNVYLEEFLIFIAKNDVDRAVAKKDEVLLNKIVSILLTSKPDEYPISWREGEARMKYYTLTNNPIELLKVLNVYGQSVFDYGTKLSHRMDSLANISMVKDSAGVRGNVANRRNSDPQRMTKGSSAATSFAYRNRDISRSVFNVVDDKNQLKKALVWVDLANKFSDNFTISEVRAGLLYKMGQRIEAMEIQEKTMTSFHEAMAKTQTPVSEKIQGRLEDTLLKMKEGKPTWLFTNN